MAEFLKQSSQIDRHPEFISGSRNRKAELRLRDPEINSE